MEQAEVQIVGVDCAVDPKRVGLARALWRRGAIGGFEVFLPGSGSQLLEWIVERIRASPGTLLAMDAPLGWPAALGRALVTHSAGAPLAFETDAMFRRLTDRVVRGRTGKQPLEVGADRIARTAHAALRLLEEIGRTIGAPVDLAWDRARIAKAQAIETYPAAWLLWAGLPARRYKDTGADAAERRALIVNRIRGLAAGGLRDECASAMQGSSHLLDAAVCVLCGAAFLRGGCLEPATATERELARKEGWIWFPADST